MRDRVGSWDSYPFSVPAIRNLVSLDLKGRLTFFVGENGSGKSTLLEAIAEHCGFGLEGGSRNYSPKTTESVRAIAPLTGALRLSWTKQNKQGFFFRAESFFNNATFLDGNPELLQAYGGKSLHQQSHGESFLALVTHRFFRKGIYLMDEPEVALSPQRQLAFLVILHELLKDNEEIQFIVATHSPMILSYPKSQIFSFDNEQISEVAYRETSAYKLVSGFLKSPDAYFRRLFDGKNQQDLNLS